MNINVTFRHMPSSDPLKEYASEKVRHIVEKYFRSGESEAHVVLSTEKFWHLADFTVSFKGMTAKVEERTEDMYSSIDLALDKLDTQLRRHKDKIRDHKNQRDQKAISLQT